MASGEPFSRVRQRTQYVATFLTEGECREVLRRVLAETAHPVLIETHVIDVICEREEEETDG